MPPRTAPGLLQKAPQPRVNAAQRRALNQVNADGRVNASERRLVNQFGGGGQQRPMPQQQAPIEQPLPQQQAPSNSYSDGIMNASERRFANTYQDDGRVNASERRIANQMGLNNSMPQQQQYRLSPGVYGSQPPQGSQSFQRPPMGGYPSNNGQFPQQFGGGQMQQLPYRFSPQEQQQFQQGGFGQGYGVPQQPQWQPPQGGYFNPKFRGGY